MPFAKCKKITKPLEFLARTDLEKIYGQTIRILEEIGIRMDDARSVKLFKDHGCDVDEDKRIVKIHESLIKEQLKNVPKVFNIYSRSLQQMEVGGGDFYMLSPSDNVYLLDPETQRRNSATLVDCRRMAKLVDVLEYYHICCTPLLPQEYDAQLRGLYAAVEVLRNTEKHYLPEPVSAMEVKYLIQMAEAIAKGPEELSKKPIMSTVICPSAPLQFPETSLAVLWGFATKRLPLVISSGPLLGLGAPVTMAGALSVQNAESISGIVHAQLVTKGLPVLFGGSALPFDMATANLAHGAIEFSILSLAEAQLARFYGVPPYGAGGATNAKTCDAQAGYEKMETTLLSYLAGLDVAVEVSLDNHSLYAAEDLVLQNEIAGLVTRVGRSFEVNEDTLALDVIKKVGIGGNFLSEKHTRTHVKTDLHYPQLSDRETYDKWLARGGKDMRTRAKERAEQLLSQHKPTPLDPEVDKKLDMILESAKKEVA